MDWELSQLNDEVISTDGKRESCQKCRFASSSFQIIDFFLISPFHNRRPQRVCWCPWLPENPIQITGKVIILQHPGEEKRNLKTGPMLQNGLADGCCQTFYGKKFGTGSKYPSLVEILQEPSTFILYPGASSIPLDQVIQNRQCGEPYNLVLLDGTWAQAKSMYFHSPLLHSLPQVYILIFPLFFSTELKVVKYEMVQHPVLYYHIQHVGIGLGNVKGLIKIRHHWKAYTILSISAFSQFYFSFHRFHCLNQDPVYMW